MQTCLVVDEAPVIRKVVVRILLRHGLTIHSVATHEEARAFVASAGLPSLALISASIGDPGGVELVRQFSAASKAGNCVILATIVEANLGLMTRLRRAGAAGYILKPFDRSSLDGAIRPYVQSAAAA